MSSLIPASGQEAFNKIKPYWNRPGGTLGTVVGLGILGGIAYFVVNTVLPVLTTMILTTAQFVIACIGLVLLLGVCNFLYKRGWFFYEMFFKWATAEMINMDPFLPLERALTNLKVRTADLWKQIQFISGKRKELDMTIHQAEKEKTEFLEKAEEAQRQNLDKSKIALYVNKSERRENKILNLNPLREKLKIIEQNLKDVHKKAVEFTIPDEEDKLQLSRETYTSVIAGSNALKRALKIFQLNPDEERMRQMSLDKIKETIALSVAEINNNMEVTSKIVEDIDLDNGVIETRGLKALDEYIARKNNPMIEDGKIIEYVPAKSNGTNPLFD